MRELEAYRRTWREFTQAAVGIYPGEKLVTKAAVANAQADYDTARLGEEFGDTNTIQTAGGAFYFMVDFDPIDGDAPIG